MIRRLFTVLSAVSLLLLVEAAILWALGHRATMTARFRVWQVVSERGVVRIDNGPQLEADQKVREQQSKEFFAKDEKMADALTAQSRRHYDGEMWRIDVNAAVQERRRASLRQRLPMWAVRWIDTAAEVLADAEGALNQLWFEFRQHALIAVRDDLFKKYHADPGPNTAPATLFVARHGWLVGGFAVLPAAWLLVTAAGRLRARRWRAVNRCGHCGYDLRGSPDRCPECGAGAKAGVAS